MSWPCKHPPLFLFFFLFLFFCNSSSLNRSKQNLHKSNSSPSSSSKHFAHSNLVPRMYNEHASHVLGNSHVSPLSTVSSTTPITIVVFSNETAFCFVFVAVLVLVFINFSVTLSLVTPIPFTVSTAVLCLTIALLSFQRFRALLYSLLNHSALVLLRVNVELVSSSSSSSPCFHRPLCAISYSLITFIKADVPVMCEGFCSAAEHANFRVISANFKFSHQQQAASK
jgi:hypothetical protein